MGAYIETNQKGEKTFYNSNHGEIYIEDWNDKASIIHEGFHLLGLWERYLNDPDGGTRPIFSVWENDIMGDKSLLLSYSHYYDYYKYVEKHSSMTNIANSQVRRLTKTYIDIGKPSYHGLNAITPYQAEPKK